MDDYESTHGASADDRQWPIQAPRVVDAFKRGSPVSITTWGGRELSGTVCDQEQTGLLLEVRDAGNGSGGYVFLPWSSIEQVAIQEISQRRVKFLPG